MTQIKITRVLVLALLLNFIPLLSVQAATLDIYTGIHSDGYVYSDGPSVASIRYNQSGVARTVYEMYSGIGSYNYGASTTPMTYRINRSFLTFQTSALPEDAVVTSAELKLRVLPVTGLDSFTYLSLVKAQPANPLQLSPSDFSSVGDVDNLTYFSDQPLTKADVIYDVSHLDGYSKFKLNDVALGILNEEEYISFAILDGHDIEGVTPSDISTVFTQSLIKHRWEMRDTPQPGSYYGYYPYLSVVYSTSSNASPVLTVPLTTTIFEGSTLSLDGSATDPDSDALTYTAANLPIGATYDSQTGQFTWTPDYNDAGEYVVTLTATDNGEPSMSASTTLTITVLNTNRAPVLSPVGNQMVTEGQTLNFTLDAIDPDGDTLTYSATNLPTGSTFDPQTRTFTWNTGYNDAGNYENIEFTVTDNGSPMELDFELITITVGDVNRAPVFESVGSQSVLETELLTFSLVATDPDSDSVTISASNLPAGASWNGTTFIWTPALTDAGVYTVTFTASDTGTPTEQTVLDVVITVGDNPTPTEQAEDLIEDVVILDLPTNVENAYMANLQKVGTFIEEGKVQAARNQLQAFINKITQDYNQGILTNEIYTSLLNAAEQLMEDLGG